jgi:predicted ester cyclase
MQPSSIIAVALVACGTSKATKESAMSSNLELNKQHVRAIYERALNQGELSILREVIAADFVGIGGATGPASIEATLGALRAGFPDIHYTVEDVLAEGDRVAIRWRWEGTHRGAFREFAATNKRVADTGIAVYQLRDGMIVRAWIQTDRLAFLQQIGVVSPDVAPPPPAPSAPAMRP